MKNYILFLFVLMTAFAKAQTTNPNLLVNIQKASQVEIDAYAPADLEIGMLVYNTDVNRIFEYTNVGFQELLTAGNIYVGHFIISATGDQTITGLPFRPTSIAFTASPNVESENVNGNGGTNNANTFNLAYGTANGYARDNGGTITQQTIFVGGNGSSINNISRYASNAQCIGVRYANANGGNLGTTAASLTAMTTDGFTINVIGTPTLVEDILVMYTAYR